MAPKHNQINLLPARWKVPTKLSGVQKRLQFISLIIMGGYIVVVLVIIGWLGFLKFRQKLIADETEKISLQLLKFRHVEAAQTVLESKAAFGFQTFKDKVNPGVALNKGTKLFSNTLQFSQLTADSTGKFSLTGTATSSAGAGTATALIEDPQGEGRKLFSKGLASLARDAQGKVSLTFDFHFIPSVPTVDLTK